MSATTTPTPTEVVIDLALRAVLDPGAFVPRGADAEGNAYGEPLNEWQRRALAVALDGKVGDPRAVVQHEYVERGYWREDRLMGGKIGPGIERTGVAPADLLRSGFKGQRKFRRAVTTFREHRTEWEEVASW